MKINSENIDELMFQLLEGDIQGEERTHLLEAIAANKVYSALWQAWQKTLLNPKDELIVMPLGPLLKRKQTVLWSWQYGIAAMLCLTIGASVFYFSNSKKDGIRVANQKPKNPKLEIIKVPTNEPVSNRLKEMDTILTLKQKMETLAKAVHETPANKSKPQPFLLPIQNIKEHLVEATAPKLIEQAPTTNNDKIESLLVKSELEKNVLLADTDISGILVSIETESKPRVKTTEIKQIIDERKRLLSRVFSKPNFKILNDSNNLLDRKILIENKKYRIIAGF